MLLRKGRVEEAEVHLTNGLIASRAGDPSHITLANIMLRSGRIEEGNAHIDTVVEMTTRNLKANGGQTVGNVGMIAFVWEKLIDEYLKHEHLDVMRPKVIEFLALAVGNKLPLNATLQAGRAARYSAVLDYLQGGGRLLDLQERFVVRIGYTSEGVDLRDIGENARSDVQKPDLLRAYTSCALELGADKCVAFGFVPADTEDDTHFSTEIKEPIFFSKLNKGKTRLHDSSQGPKSRRVAMYMSRP
jgi:hypothetical protein